MENSKPNKEECKKKQIGQVAGIFYKLGSKCDCRYYIHSFDEHLCTRNQNEDDDFLDVDEEELREYEKLVDAEIIKEPPRKVKKVKKRVYPV